MSEPKIGPCEADSRPFQEVVVEWQRRLGLKIQAAADELRVPFNTYRIWRVGRPCMQEQSMRRLMDFIEAAKR